MEKKCKDCKHYKVCITYDMIDSYQCNWFLTKAEAEEKIKELNKE